eukprot:12890-Heterococcus_DN1.PRE.3
MGHSCKLEHSAMSVRQSMTTVQGHYDAGLMCAHCSACSMHSAQQTATAVHFCTQQLKQHGWQTRPQATAAERYNTLFI